METIMLLNNQKFEMQECVSCGCVFYIPNIMGNSLRSSKAAFYCPSGHSQSYKQSEADRLKTELENKNKQIGYLNERINDLSKPKSRAARKAS